MSAPLLVRFAEPTPLRDAPAASHRCGGVAHLEQGRWPARRGPGINRECGCRAVPFGRMERHVYRPDERPDIEVLVEGEWCEGELRMWTLMPRTARGREVQWSPGRVFDEAFSGYRGS